MSTISSTQEAYEALCEGEFFQVGGELINPSDIVRFNRDPDAPTFYLEDGTTVKHDRFNQGDVGDYLAAALEVATRGSTQSEAIRPEYNRVILDSTLYDQDYNVIQTHPDRMAYMDLDNNRLVGANAGADSIYVYDLDGQNITTISFNRSNKVKPSLKRNDQIIYYNDGQGVINKVDYAGNITQLFNNNGQFPSNPRKIDVDEGAGYIFVGEDSQGPLARFDIATGNRVELVSYKSAAGGDQMVQVNREDQKVYWAGDSGDAIFQVDYTGGVDKSVSATGDTKNLDFKKGNHLNVVTAEPSFASGKDAFQRFEVGLKNPETIIDLSNVAQHSDGTGNVDIGTDLSAV